MRRRLGNVGIWVLNVILAGFTFEPVGTFRPQLEAAFGFGLPSWPIANRWASFVVAFLLLDFLIYAVHRCEHAVPFLWRFHALHHSDPDVDLTTSVRLHPVEYLLMTAACWVPAVLFGIPAVVVLSHSLAVFAAAAVTHGNISLPIWLDRLLAPVVITVDLHFIHHSISYEEGNTNFGAVLSVWDRVFGTYRWLPRSEVERIVFGVRELPREQCLTFSTMMLTPWRIARPVAADGVG
jgi:sterol desaturase/sphingolipid hydroxylase (fatty acid hydroxylase superfamily)